MKALSIDSSAMRLTVSAKNGIHTVSAVYDIGMKQSETLLPAIDYVLEKASIAPQELDYTALCSGPGSFTGLRLSFSALKAMQLAHGTPVYGVPTLEAYAEPYTSLPFLVLCAIDAKKGRFYAECRSGSKAALPAGDYEPCEIEEALKAAIKMEGADGTSCAGILLCGPDVAMLKEKLRLPAESPEMYAAPTETIPAGALFRLAERQMQDGTPPLAEYEGPVYLRASEAEIKREA
ncbi:MAG: tRNA (adenosine(37)-N6)-threonylcarbamoyltransferase complex dimerization subunit type 1 TsaB [Treponemataceae bacterium]|nr:tRNA (adenosine(37)-N6)-threonylcarbamoyltransferase complex dimerization subunit type 1 TsaB [Treponemataceae bacterium]